MIALEKSISYESDLSNMNSIHSKLLVIINNMYFALRTGESKEKMEIIFNELIYYVKLNNMSEEEMMIKYNFLNEADFIFQQKDFEKMIQDEIDRLQNGTMQVSTELINYLKTWLTNHIMQFDSAINDLNIDLNSFVQTA